MKKQHKPGDIVKVRLQHTNLIISVKLITKKHSKRQKGRYIELPEYVGWDAEINNKKDCKKLSEKRGIPFKFPNFVKTFVFEEEIV